MADRAGPIAGWCENCGEDTCDCPPYLRNQRDVTGRPAPWVGPVGDCLRLGFIEQVGSDEDGVPFYRLTDAGKEYVEQMMPARREAVSSDG